MLIIFILLILIILIIIINNRIISLDKELGVAIGKYFNNKPITNEKYLDNVVQAYNQILIAESGDVTYYYNTLYNNNNIMEDAYNVENSIDAIDYSKIKKSGLEKCREHCNGTCLDGGYTGVSSCIPIKGTNWGTLYKNPEFTYGIDVPYYNVNNEEF